MSEYPQAMGLCLAQSSPLFAKVNWQLVDQCHSSMSPSDVPDSRVRMEGGNSLKVYNQRSEHMSPEVQVPPDRNLQSVHVEKRNHGMMEPQHAAMHCKPKQAPKICRDL